MNVSVVLLYSIFVVSYLTGNIVRRHIPAFSYFLFVSLSIIWAYVFVVSFELLIIAKYSFGSIDGNVSEKIIFGLNFLLSILLGFILSVLVQSRTQYITDKPVLSFLLWLPFINLLTLFVPLPKNTTAGFELNKLNFPTISVALFALYMVRPEIHENMLTAEDKYFTEQKNLFAELVVEEVTKTTEFPYIYDPDGYLMLNTVKLMEGAVIFDLTEQYARNEEIDTTDLDNWYREMLCEKWYAFNMRKTQPYEVDVSFLFRNSQGLVVWENNATQKYCSND